MSNQAYRQEAKEEADFLLNRMWDFIDKLEKLNNEYKSCIEAQRREHLRASIENVARLLEDYKIQYKSICEEAGIEENSLVSDYTKSDIVAFASDRANEAHKELTTGEKKIKIAPFFGGVPARNKKFTGREQEIRSFIERILNQESFTICGLKGMGGIGKTEIAKEVCYILKQTWEKTPNIPVYVDDLITPEGKRIVLFPDGILWLQFEPEKQTPETITKSIISKISSDTELSENIHNIDEIVELLKDKDIIIILDSVEQNLHAFDFVLRKFKNKFPLIITSRVSIPGIHSIDIDVFSDIEAKSLFISCLESSQSLSAMEENTVSEICELLGNYPLIIERIAALVDFDNSNLSNLKNEFFENKAALLEKSNSSSEIDPSHADAKTCFNMSLERLGDLERKLFLHCSIFGEPFTVFSLATVTSNEIDETQQVINYLLRRSLVSQTKNPNSRHQTYYLHPLLREYSLSLLTQSRKINKKDSIESSELLNELKITSSEGNLSKDILTNDFFDKLTKTLGFFEYTYNYANVLETVEILSNPLKDLGLWDEIKTISYFAVRAAAALQNPRKELFWNSRLGLIFFSQEEGMINGKAQGYFEKALMLAEENNFTNEMLYFKYALSHLAFSSERWEEAILKCFKGIRDCSIQNSFHNLVLFTKTIGLIYLHFDTDKSIDVYKYTFPSSKRSAQKSGQITNFLNAYIEILDTFYVRNDFEFCEKHYKRALKSCYLTSHYQEVGEVLSKLLSCSIHLEDKIGCEYYYNEIKKNNESLGLNKDLLKIDLGKVQWFRKEYKKSIENLSSLVDLKGTANSINNYWLGRSHLYLNNFESAFSYFEKSESYFREQRSAASVSMVLSEFSLLELRRGNTVDAVKISHTSLKTNQTLGIKRTIQNYKIEKEIHDKFIEVSSEERYLQLMSEAEPLNLKPDFMSKDKLRNEFIGKDGKKMILIPSGGAFIGEADYAERYCIVDCVEDIDQFFSEYAQSKNIDSKRLGKISNKITGIYLYDYYIDQDPVTNLEYKNFCTEVDYDFPTHWSGDQFPDNTASQPVINISLADAMAYASWAGKEIPTAIEWEKACRGSMGLLYPWGDNWDIKMVKSDTKNNIREEYEKEFEALNKPELTPGCANVGHEHTWSIPSHPDTDFNDEQFLDLLERSLSLSLAEKQRVIDAIPTLSQFQVDELTKVFTEERVKFIELEKEHPEDLLKLRRKAFFELKHPLLINESMKVLADSKVNTSVYGVNSLVGSIYQFTSTNANKKTHVIKGGSWFSKDLERSCMGLSSEFIETGVKRADTGFRCVKPVFSMEDLEND